MTKKNEKILEFIRNIRNENAKGALENLKEIVSEKQKQRQTQIKENLEEI